MHHAQWDICHPNYNNFQKKIFSFIVLHWAYITFNFSNIYFFNFFFCYIDKNIFAILCMKELTEKLLLN